MFGSIIVVHLTHVHRARFVVGRDDKEIQSVVVMVDQGGVDPLHYKLTVVRLAVRAQIILVHVTVAAISPAYKKAAHPAVP